MQDIGPVAAVKRSPWGGQANRMCGLSQNYHTDGGIPAEAYRRRNSGEGRSEKWWDDSYAIPILAPIGATV